MHAPTDVTYAEIAADLAARYADTVAVEDAHHAVAQARAELEPGSRHPEFLALLVTKRATDLLHETIAEHGERVHRVPTVLFVCEHNSGRSQMAAAFAERLGAPHVHVRAVGVHDVHALDPGVVSAMAESGIDLHRYAAGPVDVLHAPDVVVEMGAHTDELVGRSYRSWPVGDPRGESSEEVRRIRDEIESRVQGLLSDLQVPVATSASVMAGSGTHS